jgi:hypothetical protein
MPLPVLDECIDFEATRTDSGGLGIAALESPARRQKRFEDTPLESWNVRFPDMNETEASALLVLFQAVGYTKPFAFEPPGALSAEAYRFDRFSIMKNHANSYKAEAIAVRQLSVVTT